MKALLFFVCCFFVTVGSHAQQNKVTERSTLQIDNTGSLNQPLYIIDDLEYKPDSTSAKSSISELDPNTIERIDVIKGQSAIDQYGNKGKNGVVVITTKEFAKKSKIPKE